MVRTVRQFERDELREALRKAGEKAVREVGPDDLDPGDERRLDEVAGPDDPPRVEDAAEEEGAGRPGEEDPSDLKCERVQ